MHTDGVHILIVFSAIPPPKLQNTTTGDDEADIIPRTFFTNFQMTFQTDILPWISNNVRDDCYNFTSVFNRWDEYQIVSFCRANVIILQGQLMMRREWWKPAVTVKDICIRMVLLKQRVTGKGYFSGCSLHYYIV